MYAVDRPGNHSANVDWQDFHRYSHRQLPLSVSQWLLDPGSLTQRLISASGGEFKVRLLRHHWQRPLHAETRLLGVDDRQWAIVREVILQCRGEPWVFARSIIPARSVSGRLGRLRKFRDSSLGELLFRDPAMRRDPFQVAVVPGDSLLLPEALRQSQLPDQPQPLWGRRCRFSLANKPILVSEIFLPAFRPWTE